MTAVHVRKAITCLVVLVVGCLPLVLVLRVLGAPHHRLSWWQLAGEYWIWYPPVNWWARRAMRALLVVDVDRVAA